MASLRYGVILLGASLLLGCTPDLAGEDSDQRSDDNGVSMHRESCGLGYDWLPSYEVGSLVAVTETHEEGSVAWTQTLSLAQGLPRVSWYSTQAHTFEYLTQDKGRRVVATAAVIAPVPVRDTQFPVITFLHGTSGLSDDCSVTADWFEGTGHKNFMYGAIASVLASYGYIVVIPDYIGLKASGERSDELHPYLVGESEAIATLDAIRATPQALKKVESRAQPGRVALWGTSQGGHAGAFTLGLAPEYAPEIEIEAAVLSVPPLNLAAQWHRGMEEIGRPTENVLMAFTAMSEYYELSLNPVIAQPLASDLQAAAHLECKTTAPLGADIEDIFLPEILAAMSEPALGGDPEWNCVLEENTPATARMAMSDIPTLVIYGEDDQLVAPALERPAFQSMCERGANLSYMECAGQTHEDAVLQTIDDTLDFIDYVFEHGESPSESCVVRQPEDC